MICLLSWAGLTLTLQLLARHMDKFKSLVQFEPNMCKSDLAVVGTDQVGDVRDLSKYWADPRSCQHVGAYPPSLEKLMKIFREPLQRLDVKNIIGHQIK